MADLGLEQVDPLVAAVAGEYYVSASAAKAAVRQRGFLNLIHLEKAVKVDIFVAGNDPLNVERLAGRKRVRAWSEPEAWLFIDTPEHSILRKLEWYHRGGEVSERQWRDVLGMLRVQGGAIDRDGLVAWGVRLGIEGTVRQALEEAES